MRIALPSLTFLSKCFGKITAFTCDRETPPTISLQAAFLTNVEFRVLVLAKVGFLAFSIARRA